jgi:hypothetical protein
MKLKEIQDPWTKKWFTPIRRNQVYETRQNQIDFNNDKARKSREEKKPTNPILNRNLKILDELMNDVAKSEIELDEKKLLTLGFSFEYCTGSDKINGNQYVIVYNYGYRLNPTNKKVIIIRHEQFITL